MAAAQAARASLEEFGISVLYTTLAELPEVSIRWVPLEPEQAVPPAPLVHCLVDEGALRLLATLGAYTFPTPMAELWDAEVRQQLMRRLNAFAQVEINLWWHAANAGYPDPPSYPVRYDLARWLWHPSGVGAIFCLRCGDELRYARAQRTTVDAARDTYTQRSGRCRACSRGPEDDWPQNALEPYGRGTWLLQCRYPGCAEMFVGRRNAGSCDRHRASRLTPRLRAARK
jgi:hypothetical protein